MRRWCGAIITFGNRLAVGGFWFSVWLYRALLVTLTGGLVGLLLSPLFKLIFFHNTSWGACAKGGFITGCEYAGIWATGIAMVWVIMDRKHIGAMALASLGKKETTTS